MIKPVENSIRLLAALLLWGSCCIPALADVPKLLNYQGYLTSRLEMTGFTCYDGTNPMTANPVSGSPHVTGYIVLNVTEGTVAIP